MPWLAAPVDWDAEFARDLDDLVAMIESLAEEAQG
jgi:hypothetical protein